MHPQRLVPLLLASCLAVCAQAPSPDSVTHLRLDFAPYGPTSPLLPATFTLTQSPVCYSADSCALVVAPGTDNSGLQLAIGFALSGKSRILHAPSIENLSYVQTISAAPTPSGTAVLVHAATTEQGAGRWFVLKPPTAPDAASLHQGFFVCFFDQQGNPQQVAPLTLHSIPERIAYLADDRYLLLLHDPKRDASVLAVISAAGELVGIVGEDGVLPADSFDQAVTIPDQPASPRAAVATPTWQIAYAGNHLLLLQPGAHPAVLEFSPNGAMRRVALKMPAAHVASGILSSDQQWLVSYTNEQSTELPLGVLQFDSGSGDLLGTVDYAPAPVDHFLYSSSGNYYATVLDRHRRSMMVKSK